MVKNIISNAINPTQFSDLEISRSALVLDLANWRETGPDSLAEVYAQYSDGNSTSFTWVVDLHICVEDETLNLPYVGEMVSWNHLKQDITRCNERHQECGGHTKNNLPQGFRVIDVFRRCIEQKAVCDFVALSYVWGSDLRPSLLTATRATIEQMKEEGGLPASEMPKTIEDAISVCLQLGERYLWADRLCIIQDDPDDKKNQIEAMGDVYLSARLVLIVAYGDSMDFGIPGVGHRRSIFQHHESVSGLQITNVIKEVEGDPLTRWSTRGWTYQEAVLSRRRLYFTNVRAFFECGQSICHEDQYNPEKIRNEFSSHGLLISEDDSPFKAFSRHLGNYTSRSLTYPSDAYYAFVGISKALYDPRDQFSNGLPHIDFDRALRWYADIGDFITCFEVPGVGLPSWSWSLVMNHGDHVAYQNTSLYGSLVPWYQRNVSTNVFEAVNSHKGTTMDNDWQVYMAIACSEGCVAKSSLTVQLQNSSFSHLRESFNSQWQDYHAFFEGMINMISVAIKNKQNSALFSQINDCLDYLKPGVLLTWTQTGFLRLVKEPRKSGLRLVDSKGEFVGGICGDAVQLEREVTSSLSDTNTLFEFIAISLSGMRIRAGTSGEQKNYFDMDGSSLAMLPIINLLLIVRRGPHAYRRELGWIYLVDWARVDREWKVVLLA
ncbi:heterokaryon incompatibility protein-domain-containing protein [Tricladium varicosporioides]|nr:heterokaryon incompatibility protein-domain-containing protein [Hymenoscyphus varicosporioides]